MVPVPPTVSIVVRSHNDIRFIRETLSMLLAQDFRTLKFLAVMMLQRMVQPPVLMSFLESGSCRVRRALMFPVVL